MMELTYTVTINAPKSVVWDTMIEKDTYTQWTKAFSEGSDYTGTWGKGEELDFLDPGIGGTRATVEVFEPHEKTVLKHKAILDAQSQPTTPDENGEKWLGSTEEYILSDDDGGTLLTVNVATDEAFRKMFDESWPKALALLKTICEQ